MVAAVVVDFCADVVVTGGASVLEPDLNKSGLANGRGGLGGAEGVSILFEINGISHLLHLLIPGDD